MITYKEFSKIIKSKRIRLDYTQRQFALMLAINVSTYNKIENGKREPSFIQLQLIAFYLDIDLTKVLKIKEPNQSYIMNFD